MVTPPGSPQSDSPTLSSRGAERSPMRGRTGHNPGGLRHPRGRVRDGDRQQLRHAAVAPIVHVQTIVRNGMLKGDMTSVALVSHHGEAAEQDDVVAIRAWAE